MLDITFNNETEEVLSMALLEEIRYYIQKTLTAEGVDWELLPLEISHTLVEPAQIRELNREYRGIDRETDVLSFPMLNFPEDDDQLQEDSVIPVLLGDIVISPAQAHKQGDEYGTGFDREMCYLTVHSVLHLLGYDHMEEEEKKVMRSREKIIMGDE